MDHLLHPWHYIPLIVALPFLKLLWPAVKSHFQKRKEDEHQVHSEDPSRETTSGV
jgi:hypothetical protein